MNDADFYREQGYLHARAIFEARQVQELRGAIDCILDGVAGTEHDEHHVWKAVAHVAVLKGFHNVQYHDAAEGTPVPAAAGDVLFLNYLTIHRSGPNTSSATRRNILFQSRDPEDPPVLRDGVEDHVDWAQGLMVAGHNPVSWQRRPRFEGRPSAL